MFQRPERFYETEPAAITNVSEAPSEIRHAEFINEILMKPYEEIQRLLKEELQKNKLFGDTWHGAKSKLGLVIDDDRLSFEQARLIAAKSYTALDGHMFSDFNRRTREIGSTSAYMYKSLYYILSKTCEDTPFEGQTKRSNPFGVHILDAEIDENSGVVFRGVNFRYPARPGDTITFNNFVSTTESPNITELFQWKINERASQSSPTLFTIMNVTLGFRLQGEFTDYPDEEEILLQPFELFEVLDVNDEQPMGRRKIILKSTAKSFSYLARA